MGSVYRQNGRKHWMIKYFNKDGRPVRESSGTEDQKTAEDILRGREVDVDRGLPMTTKVGQLRVHEALEDVVNDYKVNGYDSIDECERRIKLHLKPFFGNRRMAAITATDVRAYIVHRQKIGVLVPKGKRKGERLRDVSNGEINRELAILNRAFTLAVQGGKLLHQPYIPKLKEAPARSGFFELDQFLAVLRHLAAPLQDVATFAYLTGWRIASEVLPLEWRHVDFAANEIRLDAGSTKNGEGRVIVMTDDLRSLLLALKAESDQRKKDGHIVPWVFVRMVAKGRRGPKQPKRILDFTKAWNTACRNAGLPGRLRHDFRRTASRNMVRRGVPERVSMKLTGHKTRSTFERYNIVSDSDIATAAARLGGQLPAKKTVDDQETGS